MTTRVMTALKRTPVFIVEMCGEMMMLELTSDELNSNSVVFEQLLGNKILMSLEKRLRDGDA